MTIADKLKWDVKYTSMQPSRPNPPPSLAANVQHLKTGRLLDVACGEGAAALALSKDPQYQVTAVDVSEVGLKNLQFFASEQGCKLTTCHQDLDDLSALQDLGKFDSITVFRYKPSIELIFTLTAMLNPKGRLIISTFNWRHHLETGFSAKFCLTAGEFLHLDLPATLITYSPSQQLPFTDSYVFERNH